MLVGWGSFTPEVLAAESADCPPWIDLRGEVARRLRGRPGGTDAACEALGAPVASAWAPGRGGVRLASLAGLVTALAATTPGHLARSRRPSRLPEAGARGYG